MKAILLPYFLSSTSWEVCNWNAKILAIGNIKYISNPPSMTTRHQLIEKMHFPFDSGIICRFTHSANIFQRAFKSTENDCDKVNVQRKPYLQRYRYRYFVAIPNDIKLYLLEFHEKKFTERDSPDGERRQWMALEVGQRRWDRSRYFYCHDSTIKHLLKLFPQKKKTK